MCQYGLREVTQSALALKILIKAKIARTVAFHPPLMHRCHGKPVAVNWFLTSYKGGTNPEGIICGAPDRDALTVTWYLSNDGYRQDFGFASKSELVPTVG